MKKILAKIERIHRRGKATLNLQRSSPFYKYNGQTFIVDSIGNPGYKCRVTLIIRHKKVNFTVHDML